MPANTQDTPGRPKPGSSRQQTQPKQGPQSGAPEIDKKDAGNAPEHVTRVKYRDRPANEGKHGDESDEPNPGPLSTDTRDVE